MNKLLIVILFLGIIIYIYNTKQKSNSLDKQPILDDLNPIVMSKVNNGKLNVWTFCQDEDYNFKMSWRQPIGKFNYKYPFQKLCIQTMLKNLGNYDVNFIIQMIENKAFSPENLLSYSNYLVDIIVNLEAPIRNESTKNEWNKIIIKFKASKLEEFNKNITIILKFILNRINDINNDIFNMYILNNL